MSRIVMACALLYLCGTTVSLAVLPNDGKSDTWEWSAEFSGRDLWDKNNGMPHNGGDGGGRGGGSGGGGTFGGWVGSGNGGYVPPPSNPMCQCTPNLCKDHDRQNHGTANPCCNNYCWCDIGTKKKPKGGKVYGDCFKRDVVAPGSQCEYPGQRCNAVQ